MTTVRTDTRACLATYDSSAYFDYFGNRVGRRDEGWYSYDLGYWHFVVLNSNCDDGIGCDPYSKQLQWLSKDLSQTSAIAVCSSIGPLPLRFLDATSRAISVFSVPSSKHYSRW
jgi:hypothetical protein